MAPSLEQNAWIERVLGVSMGQVGEENSAPNDDPFDLRNRIAEASQALEALKIEGDPVLPAVLTAFGPAQTAVQAGASDAASLVDALESAIAQAKSAARGRQASAENVGVVEYAKLRLRWKQAQSAVLANLSDLGSTMLSLPDVEELDEYEDLVEAVDELPDLIPEFGNELDDVLDAARKQGADRQKLCEEALAIIANYRSAIEDVSALKELQAFSRQLPVGQLDLLDEFKSALDDIETEISKAA